MNQRKEKAYWRNLTLPGQFLLAAGVVMTLAMVSVGYWVSARIEMAVVQNSGASAALFMDSFISPLSQELALTEDLSPPARQALTEIFEGTALGARLVSYKIWSKGGRVAYASDPALVGHVFAPTADQSRAWAGEVAASFQDLNDLEDAGEAALGVPLLEVYSPVREDWTGKVIAVAEFYERAEDLDAALQSARWRSWLVVAGAFVASGFLLFGIVQTGGRTIRQQRLALEAQLETTRNLLQQNTTLRRRIVSASSRATAQMDRVIRRIGFDLHDGPAQYIALAALRLDAAFGPEAARSAQAVQVRQSVDKALQELRIISRGLALPALDDLSVEALIRRALRDHEAQSGTAITLNVAAALPTLDYARKLCLFRFLQEGLSNVTRHAGVDAALVSASVIGPALVAVVQDRGHGFDAALPPAVRDDGGQGLLGLQDRAESLGGWVKIESDSAGTTLTLTLPLDETNPAMTPDHTEVSL